MACPAPQSYCTAPECEESTRQGRRYCEHHEKRLQRCRCPSAARCQCLTAPKQERLSPQDRVVEAALSLADADSEDDAEFQRRKRALLLAVRQLAPLAPGELVRQGMEAARRRGVHVGRPHELTPEQAREMVEALGSVPLAALALKVDPRTVRRALARGTKGPLLASPSRGTRRAESPPSVSPQG